MVFLNWLFSLPVFVLSAPQARTVTHTCKVKCAQRRLRLFFSLPSSPSPSIPPLIYRFNRPRLHIHIAIFFTFISLPQVSASLSFRVPLLSPEIPRPRYPSMLLLDWRLRPRILASSPLAYVQRTCVVLTATAADCECEEDDAPSDCMQAFSYKCCLFLAEPRFYLISETFFSDKSNQR